MEKFKAGQLSRLERLEAILPPSGQGAELLVAVAPGQYSASALARAVEDCDAQLLALSVTPMRDALDRALVYVRVDALGASAVERSLARYGFDTVLAVDAGDDMERRRAMERANELLRYINI